MLVSHVQQARQGQPYLAAVAGLHHGSYSWRSTAMCCSAAVTGIAFLRQPVCY